MDFINESSPLKAMGYIVGARAASAESRREVLRRAIQYPWSSDVGGQFSDAQLMEWGDPGADRYKKIVAKLKTQIDNFRTQKGKDYSDAIRHWENDLRWLQETFEKVYGSE